MNTDHEIHQNAGQQNGGALGSVEIHREFMTAELA